MSSTYGAMTIGVSGLLANGNWLGTISDDIANVDTTGYKATDTDFSTLLNAQNEGDGSPDSGVQSRPIQLIDRQGLIQASSSPTDLAISGQGFFVVTSGAGGTEAANSDTLFTRAGSFTPDAQGNLVNAAGDFLQGYKLDPLGNVLTPAGATTSQTDLFSNLQTVNVDQQSSVAEPTRNVTLALNLPPTAAASPGAETTDITTYDAKGNADTMVLTWNATGTPNEWTVGVSFNPTSITAPATLFTVAFNDQGQLIQVGTNTTPGAAGILSVSGIDFSAVGGTAAAQPQTINIGLGTIGSSDGTTQVASPYAVRAVSQDGLPPAALSGVSVDDGGFVTATYANGLSQKIYRVPVATFNNPDGLDRENGNAYSVSSRSGAAILQPAGTGAAGTISPSALEGSTVDMSQEFSKMILAQQAYNAASKIVTTSDQMISDSVQMKQ